MALIFLWIIHRIKVPSALEKLRIASERLPTIMSLREEFELLGQLRTVDQSVLLSEQETLRDLLSKLEESHSGGAIFEVNDENHAQLEGHAEWLDGLVELPFSVGMKGHISAVADTLRARFS